MEILFYFLKGVATGVGAVTMIWYLILRPILNLPYKQWDRKMENPPPPPPRKSFKERIREKQRDYENKVDEIVKDNANRREIHGYQPTNKVDTSNPPKETGT